MRDARRSGRRWRRRGSGATIVAGYPWFTDWGRDTFIALRGLCLSNDRLADARAILLEWAGAVSEGMLPNRFPDRGSDPEFNAVDASLWFVIAAGEFEQTATREAPSLHGRGTAEREHARRRFLDPLDDHLLDAGLGPVSEIADGDPPFTPRGCPFQVRSVGELLRVRRLLATAESDVPAPTSSRRPLVPPSGPRGR